MSRLVGLHGVAKQQLGRHQLLGPWRAATADGLERALGRRANEPDLDVAYYGDLFLSAARESIPSKATVLDDGWVLDALSAEETEDLTRMAYAAVGDIEGPAAPLELETKGLTAVPTPIQRLLAALDRRFGAAAGVLYLGELRQLRRYLCEPKMKALVDDRVDEAVAAECRVLIGHSLGSVVAFESLRRNPRHHFDLFLTLGSPLGLRMVRDRMPDPGYGAATGVPANVGKWVNVRDPRDPVCCAGDLRQWWRGVDDRTVDNGADAHDVTRYLGKRETGSALLAARPELEP